jgi:hypothetical protein
MPHVEEAEGFLETVEGFLKAVDLTATVPPRSALKT